MDNNNLTPRNNNTNKLLTEDSGNKYNKVTNLKANTSITDRTASPSPLYSLEFIALGKVSNPPKLTSTFSYNNAFRSTSNDLLQRNLFSINNSKYNELRKSKRPSLICDQDIRNNNYLAPLDAYKSFQNYSIPKNVINTGTYNLAKEKLFAKDINSSLRKGSCISEKDFRESKNFLINNKICKTETANDNKITETIKKKENLKTEDNKNNNHKNGSDIDEKKPTLTFIDPNDYSKSKLDPKFLYFDKNNNQFLRHKNWWSVDP